MKRNSELTDEKRELTEMTGFSEREVNQLIVALFRLIKSRQRTVLRGLGVFEWKPFKYHLPDGTRGVTKRLYFSSQCIGPNYKKTKLRKTKCPTK